MSSTLGPGSSVGIATGYGLDGSGIESPGGVGAIFSAPVLTGPGAHPASCIMGTRSFPGVKSGRGVTLTLHLLLVPWSRKSRAIPLLPLWAGRPVQSLSACTRVHVYYEQQKQFRWRFDHHAGGELLPFSVQRKKVEKTEHPSVIIGYLMTLFQFHILHRVKYDGKMIKNA